LQYGYSGEQHIDKGGNHMPAGVDFETYRDMLARKECLNRLTGSQWCAEMDTYIALARKIASVEAFMADLIDAAVVFVQRVESSQRSLTTITANYGMLRQAVELFVEDMETPLRITNENGEEIGEEKAEEGVRE